MRTLILISVFLSVTSMAENEVPDDPYLWLEDVGGEKALEWVEAQNTISVGHLDALASEEDEDWVWKGPSCLQPDYRRCLLYLSRGGADATVVREFDVETKRFVENGFYVAEAKSDVKWVDENTLYIGTDFGDESLTDSGYPRSSRIWKRGEPLEEATEVYVVDQSSVAGGVYRTWDKDIARDIAYDYKTIFSAEHYLYTGDDSPDPRRRTATSNWCPQMMSRTYFFSCSKIS